MLAKLHNIYERFSLYRGNPCDVDTHFTIRPLGYGLALLGTSCPCCSGARLLATAVFFTFAPDFVRVAALAFIITTTLVGAAVYAFTENDPTSAPSHEEQSQFIDEAD